MDQSQSQTIHQVPSAQDAAAMCTPGAQMPGQVGMYTQFGYAPSAVSASASQAPVQAAAADASAAASPAGLKDAFIMTSAEKRIPLPQAGSANLVWKGSGISEGETIAYRACASHIDVRSDTGALIGKMFSMSYVALDEQGNPQQSRPITFAYNGGPGCASVPINFGGMGPLRVKTNGVKHLAHPIEVEDNPCTLLRETDIVFLDALGTGWSALAEGVDTSTVFGVDGDADAFCRAITTWLEQQGRWMSPVYLFGESYGTVRNSVLMRLLGEKDIKVAGVTMLSSIFDYAQTEEGSDLYHLGMTPTMAACAQYFGKAGSDATPEAWFDEVMDWTDKVLAPALLLGDRLDADTEESVAQQLSHYIGLSEAHIRNRHLRITLDDFRRHLLYSEDRVVGRLDMRFSSDAPVAIQESTSWFGSEDAADDAVETSWTSAFRAFCHDTLHFSFNTSYLSMNYHRVGVNWKWEHKVPGKDYASPTANVGYDIAVAMRRNPAMKVCILGGRYDAATPFWNVVHDMARQYLSCELKERLEWHLYGCGHMAYVDVPTLEQLSRDMKEFYAKQ